MSSRRIIRSGHCALLSCLLMTACAVNQGTGKTTDDQTAGPVLSREYRQAVQLANAGQDADATLALEQTVKTQPNNIAAYNRLGMLYRAAGRFEDARKAYESALSINPNYALAHRNLGILLDIYLQQPQQALVHYRAYAQLGGDQDGEAALWVAELQQRLGVKSESKDAKP